MLISYIRDYKWFVYDTDDGSEDGPLTRERLSELKSMVDIKNKFIPLVVLSDLHICVIKKACFIDGVAFFFNDNIDIASFEFIGGLHLMQLCLAIHEVNWTRTSYIPVDKKNYGLGAYCTRKDMSYEDFCRYIIMEA